MPTSLLPQRIAGRSKRVSRFLLQWEYTDLLDAAGLLVFRSGQTPTFTRASTKTNALDRNGVAYSVGNYVPAFQHQLINSVYTPTGILLESVSGGTATDLLNVPFNVLPAQSTHYIALRQVNNGVPYKWEYGATAYVSIAVTAANVTMTHFNGTGTVTSAVALTIVAGDLLECRAVLASTGITLGVSQNSAAEVVGTTSGALAYQAAQAAPLLRLADTSLVATFGYVLSAVRVAADTQALTAMQQR